MTRDNVRPATSERRSSTSGGAFIVMEGGLEDDRVLISIGVPEHPEWAADAVLVRAEEGWIIESVTVRPDGETIPPGGLKAAAYRSVRLTDFAQELASGRTAELVTMITGDPTAVLDLNRMPRNLDRPGRAGRGDAEYLAWAVEYREACARSTRPVADLAERHGRSQSSIRDALDEARKRELLTRPGKGRAGGELTPKAIRLLQQEDN